MEHLTSKRIGHQTIVVSQKTGHQTIVVSQKTGYQIIVRSESALQDTNYNKNK